LLGSLIWPAGFSAEHFRVSYRRGPRTAPLPIKLFGNGSFRLFTAQPGPVLLFVELVGDPSPLRVVPDVVIPEAGACEDARLRRIELSELRMVNVRVRDARGQQVQAPVAVLVLPPRGVVGRRHFFAAADEVVVPARERPQRIQVWARDHGAVVVEVHDDVTVNLPAPGRVHLTASIDPELGDAAGAVVGLVPVEADEPRKALPSLGPQPTRRVLDGTIGDVAARGQVIVYGFKDSDTETILIAIPGKYRLTWKTMSGTKLSGDGPVVDVALGQDCEVQFRLTAEASMAARQAQTSAGR
jgi:hypothetical protein